MFLAQTLTQLAPSMFALYRKDMRGSVCYDNNYTYILFEFIQVWLRLFTMHVPRSTPNQVLATALPI